MKKLIIKTTAVVFVLSAIVFGFGVQGAEATTDSSIVAHWNFDETSGNAYDSSGTGATLTNNGSVSYTTGKYNNGASFNNTNHFSNSGSLDLASSSFSISAWVKASDLSNDYDFFQLGDTGTTNKVLHLRLYTNSNVRFGFYGNDLDATSTIAAGTWYNIVVTYSSTTGDRYIYLNGTQIGHDVSASHFTGNTNLTVGKSSYHNWNGMIDDVTVYNRALSGGEVSTLATGGGVDLRAYWKFNESSGTSTVDSSGFGNDGVISSSSTPNWITGGAFNNALHLNATASTSATTTYTMPSQNSTTDFSWSFWVFPSAVEPSNAVIMGWRNAGTWLKVTPTNLEYGVGGIIPYTLPLYSWTHVTITKSGTNFVYYANDTIVGTTTSSASVSAHTISFGHDAGYPSDEYFAGMIDNAQVYSRALSRSEVSTKYQAGLDTLAPPGCSSVYSQEGSTTYVTRCGLTTVSDTQPVTSFASASGSNSSGPSASSGNTTTTTTTTTTTSSTSGNSSSVAGSSTQQVAVTPVMRETPAGYQFLVNLSYRSEHPDVLKLQNFLKAKGFLGLGVTPNGYFGPATRAAVVRLQKAKGVPATGFFGPMTRAVANSLK